MVGAVEMYRAFLSRLPAPGGGGAHRAIFAAGALGAKAGVAAEQVEADIRAHLPPGRRVVSDREIEDGVAAGFAEVKGGGAWKPRRPVPAVAPGTFERLVKEGEGTTAADIAARSPIPVDFPEWEAGWRILETLYERDKMVFIGDDKLAGKIGETIRPAGEWAEMIRKAGRVPWPKIIPNPLTGKPAPKKSGAGETLRGDGCVAVHRFAVLEMDGVGMEEQLAFWAAVRLPVAALIHSGGKSIHGWVRVDCADAGEWAREIVGRMFPAFWVPLGVDPACSNSSRLSRMPGHLRVDKGQVQRLLYLAPEGKAVRL